MIPRTVELAGNALRAGMDAWVPGLGLPAHRIHELSNEEPARSVLRALGLMQHTLKELLLSMSLFRSRLPLSGGMPWLCGTFSRWQAAAWFGRRRSLSIEAGRAYCPVAVLPLPF